MHGRSLMVLVHRNMEEHFNVNFNVNFDILLEQSNCASVGLIKKNLLVSRCTVRL